ncbi:hypothetical protein [Pseudomonas sp. McL0111]|uniref:hypothetical protein n=1 Tax=Pseudomonas sp. McL0111 TaxID=3457357 RepID=UPI00403E6B76
MSYLIDEVRTRWEFDSGLLLEQYVRWDGECTSFDETKKIMVYAQKHVVVSFKRVLVLDGGAEVVIPINETPHILPDRTGVLVVFNKVPSASCCPESPWFFNFPNNAAIYNGDGSLRFQLQSAHGKGSYIGAVHYAPEPNHPDALGVLVGSVDHNPEWLYLVDPNNSKLIPTGKWIRY